MLRRESQSESEDLTSNRIRTGYAIERSAFTAITVVSPLLSLWLPEFYLRAF
jgi:hypothetical protein